MENIKHLIEKYKEMYENEEETWESILSGCLVLLSNKDDKMSFIITFYKNELKLTTSTGTIFDLHHFEDWEVLDFSQGGILFFEDFLFKNKTKK